MGNSASVSDKNDNGGKAKAKGGSKGDAPSTLSLMVSFVNPNKRSKDQVKADRLCREKQTKSVEYVVDHLYYSMPVNIKALEGSTYDRKMPYIEIDHTAAQEMLHNEDRRASNRGSGDIESPLQAIRKTYPESVTVKENGDIEIEHYEPELETIDDDSASSPTPLSPMRSHTIPFEALCNVETIPAVMNPPRLTRATMTRIDIEWDEPGYHQLVERHEVQYRPATEGSLSSPSRWRALCTKNRLLGHLPKAFLGDLKPASSFVFRIRQGSPAGWSEWSPSSAPYATQAGRPFQMEAPFASSIGTDLVVLHWVEPDGNGAPITGYTLRGKVPGGEMKAVYMGVLDNYVVTKVGPEAVGPERIYSFDVCAHNEVGNSAWSEPGTFKTAKDRGQAAESLNLPENALRSRKMWLECWDASTEKVFYFNKFTGLRTTTRPAEFDADPSSGGDAGSTSTRKIEGAVEEEDPAVIFRMRRYRLLRKLYKASGNITGPAQLGGVGSPGRRTRQQSDANRLKLDIRRETIYEDSFEQLRYLGPNDLVRKTKIHFEGEEGIDSGGLTKDWYLSLSKAITSSGMFKQVDGESVDLEINPEWRGPSSSSVGVASPPQTKRPPLRRMNSSRITISEDGLEHYRFVGKIIGKAIYDRHTMVLPMNEVFYKILRNDPLGIQDLEQIDPALHKSLTWMLENSIEGILYETFTVTQNDDDNNTVEIDLCEKGRDRDVTDENKAEYVELMAQYRVQFGTLQQMEAIVDGISASVPLTMLQEFDVREIELLVNGREEIDVDEIRAYTIFQGKFNEQHRIVLWLWQILREFEPEERSLFLQFVTGAPRLPLDGFDPPFNITEGVDMDPLNALPTAHTCFNQLVVPRYGEIDTFTKKLKYAIQNSAGFQMS